MELDTRSCYVTWKHGISMDSLYLKPTFKSGKFLVGIGNVITLGLKGPVHFLKKKRQMNSELYINYISKKLSLHFFLMMFEGKKEFDLDGR